MKPPDWNAEEVGSEGRCAYVPAQHQIEEQEERCCQVVYDDGTLHIRQSHRGLRQAGHPEGRACGPTACLLDAEGVIRYKDVRGEKLEKAIEELLAEMPPG